MKRNEMIQALRQQYDAATSKLYRLRREALKRGYDKLGQDLLEEIERLRGDRNYDRFGEYYRFAWLYLDDGEYYRVKPADPTYYEE